MHFPFKRMYVSPYAVVCAMQLSILKALFSSLNYETHRQKTEEEKNKIIKVIALCWSFLSLLLK